MTKEYNLGQLLNEVKLAFSSKSENVALARTATVSLITNCKIDGFDMTLSQLDEIKVAVSEGVSNAIIHGYLNQEDKTVEMEMSLYESGLVIKIIDYGVGITDVAQAMEPNFTTGDERMGLGFAFMKSFMSQLIVDSQPDVGTTITMIKKIPVAEE